MERARSFGAVADTYDRFRPSPPDALAAALGSLEHLDVLDVAAGTGLVSRFLVARGARVSALEPDDDMRAVLESRSPAVRAWAGVAEAMPFPDASFDLVITSSAWHWFTQPAATEEIARVLRDGGRVAVLGNGLDRSHQWLEDLAAIRHDTDRSWGARRAREAAEDLASGPFEHVVDVAIDWTWRRSVDELVGLFRTYSGFTTRPPAEQTKLAERARALVEPLAVGGVIEAPMAMRGVLATRRAR